MFGIMIGVMIVIWKKLFDKKILLVEVDLEKYMFG
jgi:capsular polysaccharide biosynthesis protein